MPKTKVVSRRRQGVFLLLTPLPLLNQPFVPMSTSVFTLICKRGGCATGSQYLRPFMSCHTLSGSTLGNSLKVTAYVAFISSCRQELIVAINENLALTTKKGSRVSCFDLIDFAAR